MGVVLKSMQDFQYPSDICRFGRVSLLQWQKAAKGRQKVLERSEYHYLYEICTWNHDHNYVSRFVWGAKGSWKGNVIAVLGNNTRRFEQPAYINIDGRQGRQTMTDNGRQDRQTKSSVWNLRRTQFSLNLCPSLILQPKPDWWFGT